LDRQGRGSMFFKRLCRFLCGTLVTYEWDIQCFIWMTVHWGVDNVLFVNEYNTPYGDLLMNSCETILVVVTLSLMKSNDAYKLMW